MMTSRVRRVWGVHPQSIMAEGYHSLLTEELDTIAAVSDEASIVMPGTASAGSAAAAYDVVQMSLREAALATTAEAVATRVERAEGILAP